MKKKKEYEKELINDVIRNRNELIKRENLDKILKDLLDSIHKEKSVIAFFKNTNLKLKKLERLSKSDYVHSVLEIQRSLFKNRNEWYFAFLESDHYKKVMKIIEPIKGIGPLISKKMELEKYENNPDYFYYQLLDSDYTEYDEKLKINFAKQYKDLLSGYPELNKFVNDNFHSIDESHHKRTRILFKNIQELESDRIYLYELLIKKNEHLIKQTNDNKEKKELRLEIEKINNNLYSYKYADIYIYVNNQRKQGKTIIAALEEAIYKFKKSNIHLQKLCSKHNNNIENIVESLRDSYNKTPFKNINHKLVESTPLILKN